MATSFARRGLLILPALLLAGCNTVVMKPSGDIAAQQGHLILVSTMLMLLIIVPVIVLTFLFAWRYRANQPDASVPFDPEWDHSTMLELIIWGAPLLIIIALGLLTWITTHTLDPYRPLERLDARHPVTAEMKPLNVEVVALDWKWLFIYPDQGVATVNELVAPVNTPIRFKITASTVMNSFYIPALAGQIYAMPSMETALNAVINKEGDYEGFSANYSGAGFSDMRFTFHGVSQDGFTQWVQSTKAGGGSLDRPAYQDLADPSIKVPVRRFATVDSDLYHAILNRCVAAGSPCMDRTMMTDVNVKPGRADEKAHE